MRRGRLAAVANAGEEKLHRYEHMLLTVWRQGRATGRRLPRPPQQGGGLHCEPRPCCRPRRRGEDVRTACLSREATLRTPYRRTRQADADRQTGRPQQARCRCSFAGSGYARGGVVRLQAVLRAPTRAYSRMRPEYCRPTHLVDAATVTAWAGLPQPGLKAIGTARSPLCARGRTTKTVRAATASPGAANSPPAALSDRRCGSQPLPPPPVGAHGRLRAAFGTAVDGSAVPCGSTHAAAVRAPPNPRSVRIDLTDALGDSPAHARQERQPCHGGRNPPRPAGTRGRGRRPGERGPRRKGAALFGPGIEAGVEDGPQ